MKLFSAMKNPHILVVQLHAILFVACMDNVWVELQAPRFIVHRHSAILRCEHNADPDSLYKVAFYKDGQRFMQYVQGRDPLYEIFNFSGATINISSVTPTSLMIERMDFAASGSYFCDIAVETPLLYSKMSKVHEINVIVRQKYRPKIRIRHKKLSSHDILEATCYSAPAHPAPYLSWFINNEKVDERLTEPHGSTNVMRQHYGVPLSATNMSLHYPLSNLNLQPNQTVDITCLSTIPSYASFGEGFADIQNHTISVNVVQVYPAPTQLPDKIISMQMNSAHRLNIHCLKIALTFVAYFEYLMAYVK